MGQQHGPNCPCAACQKRLAEWSEEEREQQREREEALWRYNATRVPASPPPTPKETKRGH